jgi:hypothetical protein
MSIFCEVILSTILSKIFMCTCVLYWTVSEIELLHCTVANLLIEILHIVSNNVIYCLNNKVGAVHIVEYIFENSIIKISRGTTITEATKVQHIRIFGSCKDVRNFSQVPKMSKPRVATTNWRFAPIHMFHTVAQYGGREGQYWAPNPDSCTVKQLYLGNRSELDTCTCKFFYLEGPILWPTRILTFAPGTLCIYINKFNIHIIYTYI